MAARTTTKKKTPKKAAPGVDKRLVKALAHPLREQILIILNERMASPNELSKELDEGLSQVSYHVKVLKDFECIEMVKTEPRRGAVEHYYRATSRAHLSKQDWKSLPVSIRQSLSGELMQNIVSDAVEALEGNTFDARDDRHLSRTPLTLDQRGWDDLGRALDETLDRMLDIQTESGERLASSQEEGVSALAVMMGFEVPSAARMSPGAAKKVKGSKKLA